MLVWVLWNNRNNSVWNNLKEPGRSLGFKSRQLWNDWYALQQVQQNPHLITQQQQLITWQKPPINWYKCNVDAGFHKDVNKTSTGWCLRDYRGAFVAAGTTWAEGNCAIVEGESIALLEALKEITQRGISNVIFETDSKSVVDAIHNLTSG
ncbi:60S ribosomal protein L23, partial [Trifolium medium]|nr:60S ribosomal protein L23 [Trifolium medium]